MGASLVSLNDQGEAAVEVDFAGGDFELEKGFHDERWIAHGEDSHSGTQLFLECGAAR